MHVIDDLSIGQIEHVHPEAKLHVLDIRLLYAADMIATIQPSLVVHLAAQADFQRLVLESAVERLWSLEHLECLPGSQGYGLPLTVNGDGEQTRDSIYVEDIVSAIIAAYGKNWRKLTSAL